MPLSLEINCESILEKPKKPWSDVAVAATYKQTIAVEGVECVHCEDAVKAELAAGGVYTLGTTLCQAYGVQWGELHVMSANPFDEQKMTWAIEEAGYCEVVYGV